MKKCLQKFLNNLCNGSKKNKGLVQDNKNNSCILKKLWKECYGLPDSNKIFLIM